MMRNTLHALLCGAALALAGCTLTEGGQLSELDLRRAMSGAQLSASLLCDVVDDADTAATVTQALRAAQVAMDVEGGTEGATALLSQSAKLSTGQALAVLDGLALLRTYVPQSATQSQAVEVVGAGVARCLFVIESRFPQTAGIGGAILDAVDTALRWLASPAAALSASEIDIAGDLAVLCNGQGNALSLVRLDGNQTGTEVKTITAHGKPRTCVVAGGHVVTSEIVAGNPATLDLAVYAVPTLVETDRIPGAGLPVVLRPGAGESLIYAQGSTRRCRYGLAAGELTEQLCRVPSATGIAPALTPTLLATFLSTTAELWTLPGLMGKADVSTGRCVGGTNDGNICVTVAECTGGTLCAGSASRSSTDGESIVANGRDLMPIEAGVVRSRVASVWATLGVLITDGAVYLARGATGTQPNRVDVYSIDPVTRQLSLSRTVPTSLANDLARGPDGVYQSDASLGILRVERIGVPPTAAPTFPPPTRTNTQAVALSTATRTNTPGEGVLRACVQGCLAE